MAATKTRSSFLSPIVIIIFLFAFIFVIAGTYLFMQKNKTGTAKTNTKIAMITPTSTPTPRAIPHGKIGFSVGGSKPNAPTFGRGFLDPYDPKKGAQQIISIEMADKTAVTDVTGTMITDHGQQPVTFSLVEGTAQKGRWEAKATINDSYLYTYKLTIIAKNATTQDAVDITLR